MGPLAGVRVLEFSGIGPAPFCAMLLADMGAEVLRVDRQGEAPGPGQTVLGRGKAAIGLDLKTEAARALCLELADRADVLIEGFRPGVMERLGLGPEPLRTLNPRLIYGRMTGWGQTGPLASAVGHDLGYIAVAGALDPLGEADRPPPPPLNLLGDFGGGAMYLAFGITAALVERERSGEGQVVDAAIVDGTAHLMTLFHGLSAAGVTGMGRGQGLLAGAAPFYRCYRCADGLWVSVAAIEPRFYAALLEGTGASGEALGAQYDRSRWPEAAEVLAAVFLTRSRSEWCALLEGTEACVAPVMGFDEAPGHAHLRARGVFEMHGGLRQPAPAPRFSRTPGGVSGAPPTGDAEGWVVAERWTGARLARPGSAGSEPTI